MIDMPRPNKGYPAKPVPPLYRKTKTTLDEIVRELGIILSYQAHSRCDPYVLQVGDITPSIIPILEDLRALNRKQKYAELEEEFPYMVVEK
jgi:hypothetical protein